MTAIPRLAAPALLDLHDAVGGRAPIERGVALLAACVPGLTREKALMLDIGSFHALLLDICERQLGPVLNGRADCPICGAALDVRLETAALRQPPGAGPDAVLLVDGDAGAVLFRLPRPADLLALDPGEGPDAARRKLLSRCVVGEDGPELLSEATMTAMAEAMARAAPQADLVVPVACAGCGHDWETPLDTEAFLSRYLEVQAEHLTGQVHALASAYHWSEAEILALPHVRRRRYLDWIEA